MNGAIVDSELPRLPKGISVSRDPTALKAFAQDSSGRRGAVPKAIVRPKTEQDVRSIVSWARANSVPLVPVSSSTGPRRRGDTVTTRDSVILDLSEMRRIIHVDGEDALAIIEPGVTFPELDEALRPHGLRSFRPLVARPSKSVLAAFLEREPATVPGRSWDSSDPLAAMQIVLGDGKLFHTGSGALPGTLEENLERGNRPVLGVGPLHTDFGRVIQGAQGALGIVTWASIYCQRIPARERPLFISADRIEPLVEVAYTLLRRRPGGQLFLVNARQLAMLFADNSQDLDRIAAALPAWVLYFEVSAPDYFADEAMEFQLADVEADVRRAGAQISAQLGEIAACQVRPRQESGQILPCEGAAEIRREVLCLGQLNALPKLLGNLPAGLADQAAIHVQPMVHGVTAQLTLTFMAAKADEDGCDRSARDVAESLASAGAFFSRPYHPWAELPFAADPAIAKQLSRVKGFFDPDGILQPGAQSLGGTK
jgi:FAD/FMN-containing dehydrogenase